MLRKVHPTRHVIPALAVLGMTGAAGAGIIGSGDQNALRGEHFDAKVVVVQPDGADGVRLTEFIDIDFGANERRGYERIIPTDFGEPTSVEAASPDANSEVSATRIGGDVRIRVGNRNITFTGQHRYRLGYTLPEARVSTGELNLDIIGTDETFTTDRFEVRLVGFDFTDTYCDTGARGSFGGCSFIENADGDQIAVIEPLEPGEGITVGGDISGVAPLEAVAVPDLSERNPTGFRPIGWLMLLLGGATVGGVFGWARWRGSNEVRAGGAADAAYGDVPVPAIGDPIADVPTYRVPDSRLAELATIEFVPPRGIEPWQGAALLREDIDDDTVGAWFSEMIARRAIEIDDASDGKYLTRGDGDVRLSSVDHAHLDKLFSSGTRIELGDYDKGFTSAWASVAREQQRFIRDSGWWASGFGGGGSGSGRKFSVGSLFPLVFFALVGWSVVGPLFTAAAGALSSSFAAALLTIGVTAGASYFTYRTLLPSRSATGSALTLRTESFRRFLAASEGRHVEWAYENKLLREYSAWAVALGAADAWSKAVESSNIPHPETILRGPMFIHTSPSWVRTTRTRPAPKSSGGGGGFGGGSRSSFGGSVGGGGGGGSSGSW